jgi:hypothetical protein
VVGLSDPATGQTRAVVVFASGPYLVVSEMDALPPFAAAPGPLIALAEEVAGAAPGTPDAGAAQGLGVPTSLRAAIRSAFRRARPQDPATRTGPLPGTVSAALLDGRIWAVADMGSPAAGDPQLFRGTADGGLQAVGRVRVAAGCPVLPRSLRLTWGLDEACPAGTPDPVLPGEGAVAGELPEAVRGVGHWVWELERSAPSPEALADRAVRAGIRTLYVKSGDGARYWSQFDRAVGPLKARGLRVCGWQYVYGRAPEAEARVAARAVRAGADCFVVDAEIEFERGRLYGPARRYMRALRAEVGRDYPVGLTSFAYVDLHRSFPYSAFLAAPDGAQFTMPQVYWKAFRVPVAVAMERTYRWNRIYGVPIAPIGGTYLGESAADILRFRCAAELLGSASVSYWSWQHTRGGQWGALASPVRCAAERQGPPASRYPELGRGSTGDPVVWLQTRLRAWGERVPVDGRLGSGTLAAVQRVRARAGLGGVTTRLDDPTWELLLTAPGTAPAAPAGVARRG